MNMISDIYFRLLLDTITKDPSIIKKPIAFKDFSLGEIEGDPATRYFSYLVEFVFQNNPQSNMGLSFGKNVVALNLCDFFRLISTAETVEECLLATVSIYHILGLLPYPVVYKGSQVSSVAIAFPYEPTCEEYTRRFTSEVFFAYGLDLFQKAVSKDVKPIRMFLDYPKPDYFDDYQNLFNCEIIYNSPISLVEFPSSMLSASLASQNDTLHNIYMAKAFEHWAATKRNQSFRYRAITQLMSQPGGNFSSASLAKAMNISTRGLQKRLAAENSTYSQVCKQARRELAKICLFQKGMDFDQTATALGFQTQVSFRKFFKEQFEGSPEARLLSKPDLLELA